MGAAGVADSSLALFGCELLLAAAGARFKGAAPTLTMLASSLLCDLQCT